MYMLTYQVNLLDMHACLVKYAANGFVPYQSLYIIYIMDNNLVGKS